MRLWRRFHERSAWIRRPLKLLVFVVGTGLVLYPKPWLLPTWIERIRNVDAMIEPQHPGLAPFEAEIKETVKPGADAGSVLQAVQKVVYKRVPYAWDWDVWGVVEYLPTVGEVLEQGREDCDGRAVVAASLLRRLGYEAHLASDVLHMWVVTPQGETMSPTGGEKTLVGGPGGTQTRVSFKLLGNFARGLSYGVAAFPLLREAIILGLLALVTMHPWSSGWRRLSGVLLLWIALDTLRAAGMSAALQQDWPSALTCALGVALAIAGWLTLALKDRAARRAPAGPARG